MVLFSCALPGPWTFPVLGLGCSPVWESLLLPCGFLTEQTLSLLSPLSHEVCAFTGLFLSPLLSLLEMREHQQCYASGMKAFIAPLSMVTLLIFNNRILDLMFSSLAHGTCSWISSYWMDLDLGTDLWPQEHGGFHRTSPIELCALI